MYLWAGAFRSAATFDCPSDTELLCAVAWWRDNPDFVGQLNLPDAGGISGASDGVDEHESMTQQNRAKADAQWREAVDQVKRGGQTDD